MMNCSGRQTEMNKPEKRMNVKKACCRELYSCVLYGIRAYSLQSSSERQAV